MQITSKSMQCANKPTIIPPRKKSLLKVISSTTLERLSATSIVVDITYQCNAQCKYCQWGDDTSKGTHQNLKDILIPATTLANFDIKRIVLSGGEPRLHPKIKQILDYYSNLVDDVIIITNGYHLTTDETRTLLQHGATGITISLDSIDSTESYLTRLTPTKLHKEILSNIRKISKLPRNFELGINATVSNITSNWSSVNNLLKFGKEIKADFVKFQPIFDDGYPSKNSPDLLLSNNDVPSLLNIASKISDISYPLTNPPKFWSDIATICSGKSLPSHACSLGPRHTSLIRGNLDMCFWIDSSYGSTSQKIHKNDLSHIQKKFETQKHKCNVDFHCFCNQGIDHVWTK